MLLFSVAYLMMSGQCLIQVRRLGLYSYSGRSDAGHRDGYSLIRLDWAGPPMLADLGEFVLTRLIERTIWPVAAIRPMDVTRLAVCRV
jgi:hypothetical protein